jgi:hypothetical protein
MKHIAPDKMTERVRVLFEIGQAESMSPEQLAAAVGVNFVTVYRWFRGAKPLPSHEELIAQAICTIENERRAREGMPPAASWVGNPAPNPEEKVLDRKLHKVLAELMKKADWGDKKVISEHWGSFREIAWQLRKHRVRVRF